MCVHRNVAEHAQGMAHVCVALDSMSRLPCMFAPVLVTPSFRCYEFKWVGVEATEAFTYSNQHIQSLYVRLETCYLNEYP